VRFGVRTAKLSSNCTPVTLPSTTGHFIAATCAESSTPQFTRHSAPTSWIRRSSRKPSAWAPLRRRSSTCT
jgi:uncharacterized protein (DUF2062 family)